MAVDLHTHTTYSDGTCSPRQLLSLADHKNLTAIAITDHDISAGAEEALQLAADHQVSIVAGVEISIDYPLPKNGHLHILGLFIDPANQALNEALAFIRDARSHRNQQILQRLADLGMQLTEKELQDQAGQGSAGRPHIARLLVKKGFAKNSGQAFQKYLKKGAAAYAERSRFEINQAIELIKQAGGLSILAHPLSMNYRTYQRTGEEIIQLQKLGLDGIEVYYCAHNPYATNWFKEFAVKNQLAVSGGSDFHGEVKADIQLGSGKGNLQVPDRVYWELLKMKDER